MKVLLDQVCLRYAGREPSRREVLSEVSFAMQTGERLAIIGPSGAGKTSLLHVLACAQRPTQGQLLLADDDPWSLSNAALKRKRGQLFLAPQIAPLVPRQRVVTSVLAGQLAQNTFWKSLKNWVYPGDLEAVHSSLAQFDLSEKLFERVDRLSGGERQRVGLARALVAKAQLMLIDEPLSALDPQRGVQALTSLCEAAAQEGATLVATLHHVDMALKFFPRIIGMAQGRIHFDKPVAEVTPALIDALYRNQPDGDAAFEVEPLLATGGVRTALAPTCR